MHVFEFFDLFLMTPYVEVVKPSLPELARRVFVRDERERELCVWPAPLLRAQSARDSLLEDLHHSGRSSFGWFAEQQMDMIWHHNIADQEKSEALSHFRKNTHKHISRPNGIE